MERTTASPMPQPLESTALHVGALLGRSFRRLVGSLSPTPIRPVELEKICGVGKDLSYRILKATQADDPMAVLHLIPGPAPLRQFVRGAARRGAHEEAIAEAEAAIDAFDQLIRVEAGDRATLDAILAGWLPEARQKVELLSKQSLFRGFSQIKGISADVLLEAAIVHPSSDGLHHDAVIARIMRGLRRWRQDALVRFVSRRIHPHGRETPVLCLTGEPISSLRDLILAEYSSIAAGDIEILRTGTTESYALRMDEVGRRSECELAAAEFFPACLTRYRTPDNDRRSAMFSEVHLPAKLLVFDLLLHRDVNPQAHPELVVFDTTVNGPADINDPSRHLDRLPVSEHIMSMGQGVAGLRLAEAPRYVDVLRTVLARRGWSAESFRAFRCRIEFPLYGSQVSVAFERAPRPADH